MRLINTETLALEEFYGKIPPYAILSHRWESEEVTLQDFQRGRTDDWFRLIAMKGWMKIRYCIDQAKRDGLGYCWVDSCCIDKSSSAELTEAINSMYAWYRDSSVCYIYMSGVSVSSPQPQDVTGSEVLHQEFMSSQCFGRGWTLQELLAPRKRKFYNVEWKEILDLDHAPHEDPLMAILLKVTGIPSRAIERFDLYSGDYSVAQKMSWASKRKTTRIEDTAYCLMGIFDINMPLLYGEGPKSFLRLQHEIIRKSNDQSIFCWSDPSASLFTHRGLLATSPGEFEGSTEVMPVRPRIDENTDLSSLDWDNRWEQGQNEDVTFLVTNRGLQISLPLAHVPSFRSLFRNSKWVEKEDGRIVDGEFLAQLNCMFRHGQGISHGECRCYLVLTHPGNGNFARVDVSSYKRSQWENEILCGAADFLTVKRIFVQDNPEVPFLYSSPRIRRALFSPQPPLRDGRMVHVEPHQHFNGDETSTHQDGDEPWIYLDPGDPTTIVTLDFRIDGLPVHVRLLVEWVDQYRPASTPVQYPAGWFRYRKLYIKFADSGTSVTSPTMGFADDLMDMTNADGQVEVGKFQGLIRCEPITLLSAEDEPIIVITLFHN